MEIMEAEVFSELLQIVGIKHINFRYAGMKLEERWIGDEGTERLEEINDFVHCINTRSKPNVGGQAGAKALEIAQHGSLDHVLRLNQFERSNIGQRC